MKKTFFFFFIILLVGCSSTPKSEPTQEELISSFLKKNKEEFDLAEKIIFDAYSNKEFVLWYVNTEFASLDIDNTSLLQNVKIKIDEAYPDRWYISGSYKRDYCEFRIILSFLDKNGDNKEVVFATSYSGEYKNKFTNDILNWINENYYYVKNDAQNFVDKAPRTILLVNNSNLKIVYNNMILANQNRREWQQLLTAYGTTNYVFFRNLIGENNYNTPNLYKEWESRGNIQQGTLMFLRPGEVEIFGTKPNTYICEADYYMVAYNAPLINAIAQFVIIDDLGKVRTVSRSTIRNANGPDSEIAICSLDKSVLLKCIGQTNITLQNGRIVPRLLFQTIEFRNDDPNKP